MYDYKKVEEEIVDFWKKNKIYRKVKGQNKGKKPFYFLQGPPYTSGKIHAGQAWNNSLKDFVLRYKRMQGFDVWDRAGYDMHGLPTSLKVQKKLGLKQKKDIEKYGMGKFVKECMDFSITHAQTMNEDLFRLGIWMDYDNAYMPIKDEWIESVWWLIKTADEKGKLYEGDKTITWCAHCETALAKHECEYKEVTDKSIYVKFKLKDTNEHLLIWTTTPWTIPLNLAVMVHPDFTYVKARVDNEVYIIAKDLLDKVIKDTLQKEYEVLEEIKGKDLEGLEYEHPLGKEIGGYKKLKSKHPKAHTIVLSNEYVTLDAGTGLVHTAPGCGPEDYEVGYKNKIPPFNPLDERGIFPNNFGSMSKWVAKKDDNKFIDKMTQEGMIIGTENIEHDYAHCERCHNPVIYRATRQWFFKIEDIKERMLELNKSVHWVPDKTNESFKAWISNLRDNSITKQRYWGTPAPIWRCSKCKDYTVISSKEELTNLAGKAPENLHRPWVDEIKIKCKCGYQKRRIPDIIDVWIDAGVGSYACLHYPKRTDTFEKLFPADFILEATEQTRLWYSLLTIASTIAFDKMPFKAVYNHGMLLDVEGVKMSKSLGNVISPYEIIDKYGADTLRTYMCSTKAGEDINFSWDELKQKYKNLTIIWNICQYLVDYCKDYNIEPTKETAPEIEEKYILSKLNRTIKKVTELYDFYSLDEVPEQIENLFLDLSREYIQLTRDKVLEKPELVLSTIYKVLFETIKMLTTTAPLISEKIYQLLKKEFNLKEETISLYRWPGHEPKLINNDLEKEFSLANGIIQAGLAAREKAALGVRWPIQKITVISRVPGVEEALSKLDPLIKLKLNVKQIELQEKTELAKVTVVPNKTALGRDFKQDSIKILSNIKNKNYEEIKEKSKTTVGRFNLTSEHFIITETLPKNICSGEFSSGKVLLEKTQTPELEQEGFARELIRKIQDLRKEKGLKKKDKINITIKTDYDLTKWKTHIKDKVGAKDLEFSEKNLENTFEAKIRDKMFVISFSQI